MLYTLSKAEYTPEALQTFLGYLTNNDVVILWQDGILRAVKNKEIFAKIPNCYLLEQDVIARGLTEQLNTFNIISLCEFIKFTETYFPHIGI